MTASDPAAESGLAAELRSLVASIADGARPQAPGELPAYWADVTEAGLPLIGVPEERGGSGGTIADLAVVCYELGRHGLGGPLAYSATAAWALSVASPTDPVLRTVAAGNLDAAGGLTACAPWGRHAGQLVLLAGDSVFVAGAGAATVTELGQDIAGEPADTVRIEPGRAALVAGDDLAAQIRGRLDLLLAAAITGAGQGAVALTRGYVAERRQFDAPLLTIPAVTAGLARMRAALIQSDAALARAIEATVTAEESLVTQAAASHPTVAWAPRAAAVARVIAAQAATEIARTAHQLHGAIGITAEYPLARYTARLWAWRDAQVSEQEHALNLGALAAAGGESALWLDLTS